MGKTRMRMFAVLMLCAAVGSALARNVWHWTVPHLVAGTNYPDSFFYLSPNNGSHTVAMTQYNDGSQKVWTSILAYRFDPNFDAGGRIRAYEFKDIGSSWNYWQQSDSWPSDPGDPTATNYHAYNCNTALNSQKKVATWGNFHGNVGEGRVDGNDLADQGTAFWTDAERLTADPDDLTPDSGVAVAMFQSPSGNEVKGCAAFAVYDPESPHDVDYALYGKYTINGGASWDQVTGPHEDGEIATYYDGDYNPFSCPSLATDDRQGSTVMYLAFESTSVTGQHAVVFTRSTDCGKTWPRGHDGKDKHWTRATQPCIAALGRFVFLCWTVDDGTGRILYSRSTDGGDHWSGEREVTPYDRLPPYWSYDRPNAACVPCPDDSHPGVVVVARLKFPFDGGATNWWTTRGMFTRFWEASEVCWEQLMPLCGNFQSNNSDEPLNPSIAAIAADGLTLPLPSPSQDAIACCVMSTPSNDTIYRRNIREAHGYWGNRLVDAAPGANTARLLALGADGAEHYGCARWPYIATGQVIDGTPVYDFGANGKMPALAVDADGTRWTAYVESDTLWCRPGGGEPEWVFAGSSSAVPGQPSIVCYPNQANGVSVASVVFPVYDTAGTASRIMYARVDTGAVVLDTIEGVANLGDSLPCVSVFRSDTLVVTWQHGDSTLASMLCDYGPGTSGRPSAWSSPSLVTANGYHAMSRFDDNGTVLNVTWTRNNGSNYAIQRASCDLATTAFGNWSTMATPGDTGSYEKANPVFAGLGVSCYQQKNASGKWTIKGFVRGEEVTLVDNDTDAYHPHAVAESSAVSPSIDQVRVHLLYTAGVTSEVDSGVYDTGETRYVCESLNVSRATSDATKYNNGAKLVRKASTDSIFSVYSDLDNAVVFAWSANGDTWQRSVMASGRDYPAIAEDSSGKRWVVMRKPGTGMLPPIHEAYYRSGSSWTGPETLYAVSGTTLGPASLSGSSYTTSGIAYAAFIFTAYDGTQSLILAKFNGTNVSTYTVATGTTLGDPCITVEPYLADSDHVHVTWTDNGTLKYRMDTDGRSSSIASNWTSTHDLTGRGITASHPYINSDHDQIVVAWAQGSATDIYSCKRSTDSAYNNWEAAANLSNTANDASDYPTVAMGDTVVVAWQEARTGGTDFDILACIDFGDTLNIADNATVSSYPHVLFQNKASGDTFIPYLHTIFSETPEAEYYEVGYNKLNLKQASGGGQQSASSTPIPVKPSLAACRPNPFKSHTQISYALPTAGNVSLRVYDVTGRTVRTLESGHQKAGNYSVSWDARDSHGKQVPYGIYFYRLDTPGFRSVKKAVVAR